MKKNSRSRSAASRAAKNRNAAQLAYEKTFLAHNNACNSQIAAMSSGLIVDSHIALSEGDGQNYGPPSMLFRGLDCFELESPSFSQLISSSLDGDFPLTSKEISRKEKSRSKCSTGSGSKKRSTYCLAVEVDAPKPRTPRRKLNNGSASFDDFDLDYSITPGFPGVGTPSNYRLDPAMSTRHLWGQDVDLASGGGYADTFLDIPTPRLADVPLDHTSNQSTNDSGENTLSSDENQNEKLEHPRLIRTNSVEQEGLSYFLEQTNLDEGTPGDDVYQMATTSLFSARKSPFSSSSFFAGSVTPRSAAAAVDECFSRSTLNSTWPMPSVPSSLGSKSCSKTICMNARELKHAPEFETLTDEYKLTDIDHELDSFYLETMESIGNDLNLVSN